MAQTHSLIAAQNPNFVTHGGDISYANECGTPAVHQYYQDQEAWSESAAFQPAWGNHEYGSPQPDSVPGAIRDTMENYKGRSFITNGAVRPERHRHPDPAPRVRLGDRLDGEHLPGRGLGLLLRRPRPVHLLPGDGVRRAGRLGQEGRPDHGRGAGRSEHRLHRHLRPPARVHEPEQPDRHRHPHRDEQPRRQVQPDTPPTRTASTSSTSPITFTAKRSSSRSAAWSTSPTAAAAPASSPTTRRPTRTPSTACSTPASSRLPTTRTPIRCR